MRTGSLFNMLRKQYKRKREIEGRSIVGVEEARKGQRVKNHFPNLAEESQRVSWKKHTEEERNQEE